MILKLMLILAFLLVLASTEWGNQDEEGGITEIRVKCTFGDIQDEIKR
jgi:hypothetical protein